MHRDTTREISINFIKKYSGMLHIHGKFRYDTSLVIAVESSCLDLQFNRTVSSSPGFESIQSMTHLDFLPYIMNIYIYIYNFSPKNESESYDQ